MKKKNKARSSITGYRGDRCRPSLQTLIIECYPAALKYAQTIIIPPSVFNYGRRKGEGLLGERSEGSCVGRGGWGGWASSHIKVYRRPLALGGFVESSCILTHILARGQVTLLDYYQRGRRFGALAQLARFLVPALSPLERIRLRTRTY